MAVLILIIFFVFCVGALVQPRWALALLLLMYPLEQAIQGSVPFFIEQQSLVNYIVGIVVVLSAAQGWLRGKLNTHGYLNPIWLVFISAYVYSFISLLWTPSQAKSWSLISEGYQYVVMYIIIAPLLVDDVKDWNRVLFISLIFGLASAIAILTSPSFTLESGRLGFNFTSKIRSSPLAIGELGGFLMLTSSLLVPGHRHFWMLAIRVLALLCGVVLSIFSGSRGQFFFAVILLIIFFPLSRPIKNLAQFFMICFGSIALLLLVALIGSFLIGDVDVSKRWLSADKSNEAVGVRLANAFELLNAFMRSPSSWLQGLGHNAFTSFSGSQEPYSHIMFIDVLAEMGIVATIILIACLFKIIAISIELLHYTNSNPQLRSAAVVLVALCAYQLLLMNKQGELWSSQNTVVYFILLAKVFWSTRAEMNNNEPLHELESTPIDPVSENKHTSQV
jgi:hypothetical protein